MIKLPAYFTGYSSKNDGSLGLRFATQEVPAEISSELHKVLNSFGWLVYAEEGNPLPDIPKEDIKDKRKSQAEIIRAVLFRIHEQGGGKKEDFERFYQQKTNEYIEFLKKKLD